MVSPTDLPHADHGPHIVLGLVGAPGAAFSLACELADTGLSEELERRLPGARWRIEVVEGRLVQPPATDAAIVAVEYSSGSNTLSDPTTQRLRPAAIS